jgi:hypothetical protein
MSFIESIKSFFGIHVDLVRGSFTEDAICLTLRSHYGLISSPSCIAYDAVQKLVGVGSQQNGLIKMYVFTVSRNY